eukprot:1796715-Rhodomonas_salina.1
MRRSGIKARGLWCYGPGRSSLGYASYGSRLARSGSSIALVSTAADTAVRADLSWSRYGAVLYCSGYGGAALYCSRYSGTRCCVLQWVWRYA